MFSSSSMRISGWRGLFNTTRKISQPIIFSAANMAQYTNGVPPDWTYARTGNTWDYDATGVMQQFGAGVLPRGYDPVTREFIGALVEGAATNYLWYSDAPATQSQSLAAGTYCLRVLGSGSCALSGGPTGTATQGSPVVFTLVGTTTVTFTVSGTLTNFQCEVGYTPSSFILTAGAAAARVRSDLILPLPVQGFSTDRGTFVVDFVCPIIPASGIYCIFDMGTNTSSESFRCGISAAGMYLRSITGGVTTSVTTPGNGATYVAPAAALAALGIVAGKRCRVVGVWYDGLLTGAVGGPLGVLSGDLVTTALPTISRLLLAQFTNTAASMGNTHFLDAFFLPYAVSAQQRQLLAQVR